MIDQSAHALSSRPWLLLPFLGSPLGRALSPRGFAASTFSITVRPARI
jgi:hypothetical protein